VNGAWTYQGTSDTAKIEVEHGRLVAITFDGQALAQGTDTADVFTFLDQLANAIDIGDDAAMAAALAGASALWIARFACRGSWAPTSAASMRPRSGCLSCARRAKRADRRSKTPTWPKPLRV
jgi:hypothetical protein